MRQLCLRNQSQRRGGKKQVNNKLQISISSLQYYMYQIFKFQLSIEIIITNLSIQRKYYIQNQNILVQLEMKLSYKLQTVYQPIYTSIDVSKSHHTVCDMCRMYYQPKVRQINSNILFVTNLPKICIMHTCRTYEISRIELQTVSSFYIFSVIKVITQLLNYYSNLADKFFCAVIINLLFSHPLMNFFGQSFLSSLSQQQLSSSYTQTSIFYNCLKFLGQRFVQQFYFYLKQTFQLIIQ
eukprot:TRINITY_DN9292_c1_g1_i1.p1 TRINITY_DN9292_c1_g1~~TRINITY_DN9292_c1_g1_i1.p1  ORF type:complete len:248 (+),score=-19.23 TRINITY_DN9292_c1_g1_i1:28-744(+)